MTKSPSTTIEEIANTMSAATARAMKGLREVSDAIAELREAELMLKGPAASRPVAVDDHRKSGNGVNMRLAYRVDELAQMLGVSTKTIKRRIADGTLKTKKVFGARLIEAESVKALFEPQGDKRGQR
jgi:excisionase family DNA binding protein